MRKVIALFSIISAIAFTSCSDDDGYSLDKYWVSMATIDNPSNDSYYFLNLDNGEKLWTAANAIPWYKPKTGQRIFANYTLLSDGNGSYDHDIKLNGAYEVLTKPIITLTEANQDSIGNDPLRVIDAWVGSDYLNIEFEYPGYNKTHMVNLVKSDLFDNTGDAVNLEFRQNGFGDQSVYWLRGIVSFKIDELQQEGLTSKKIKVSSVDDKGNVNTFEVVYDWSKNTEKAKSISPESFKANID